MGDYMKEKINLIDYLFGLIFALIYLVGKSVCETHNLDGIVEAPWKSVAILVSMWAIATICLRTMFWLFFEWKHVAQRGKLYEYINKPKTWMIMFLSLILVYLVCWLSFYPGNFTYDAIPQTEQALGIVEWTNHHPILHTFIWKVFLKIGNTYSNQRLALALYCITQIIIVSGVCVKVTHQLFIRLDDCKLIIFAWIYYLCTPTLQIFSFMLTKDVLFSCFVLLFILSLLKLIENPNWKNMWICVLYGLLTCLFRNNMIYVFLIVLLGVLLLRFTREMKIAFTIIVFVYFFIIKVIYPNIGIELS